MGEGGRQARAAQPEEHRRCPAAAGHQGKHRAVRNLQGPAGARAPRPPRDHGRDLQQDREYRRAAHGADGEPLHPAGGVRVPDDGGAERLSGQVGGRQVGRRQEDARRHHQADRRIEARDRQAADWRSSTKAIPRKSTRNTSATRSSRRWTAVRESADALESSSRTRCGRSRPIAKCCSSSKTRGFVPRPDRKRGADNPHRRWCCRARRRSRHETNSRNDRRSERRGCHVL